MDRKGPYLPIDENQFHRGVLFGKSRRGLQQPPSWLDVLQKNSLVRRGLTVKLLQMYNADFMKSIQKMINNETNKYKNKDGKICNFLCKISFVNRFSIVVT